MSNINTVALSGNLTRDPELRQTPSGTSVCSLRMAVNRRRKSGDEYVDETAYFDVTAWQGLGELCAKKLEKGSAITVQGRLDWREWETDDGGKRQAVQIVANEIDGKDFYKPASENRSAEAAAAPAGESQNADDIPF